MHLDALLFKGIGLFFEGQFVLFELHGVQTTRYFERFSGDDGSGAVQIVFAGDPADVGLVLLGNF